MAGGWDIEILIQGRTKDKQVGQYVLMPPVPVLPSTEEEGARVVGQRNYKILNINNSILDRGGGILWR